MADGVITFPLAAVIHCKDEYGLVVGLGDEEAESFRYDRKLNTSVLRDTTSYVSSIVGHDFKYRDGTYLEDWVSGSEDVSFDHLSYSLFEDRLTITPIYSTGLYNYYWDDRTLFSDFSVSANIFDLTATIDGLENSFQIRRFHRDDLGRILTAREFDFTYSWPTVTLDADPVLPIGANSEDSWEIKESYAQGASVYLNYFPVQNVIVKSYEGGVYVDVTETSDIFDCATDDYYFQVDEDLGIILLSGGEYESLYLQEVLADESETALLKVYPSTAFSNYPTKGYLLIDGEEIQYRAKGNYAFLGCQRAVTGVQTSHSIGSEISLQRLGLTPSGPLHIKYEAGARIDYEVEEYSTRTASNYSLLNVSPLYNTNVSKIVEITSTIQILTELVLTIDKPLIATNYYGPAFFGTDVARVDVLALGQDGSVIPNIDVTIEIISGEGTFENFDTSIDKETNTEGMAFAFYNSSLADGLGYMYASETVHDGADTVLTVPNMAISSSVDEITVFQILKQDPTYGTSGLKTAIYNYGAAAAPFGLAYFDCLITNASRFEKGQICAVIDDVKYWYTITQVVDYYDGIVKYQRFYVDVDDALTTDADDYLYLFTEEDILWDPLVLNGVPVLLYKWSTDYEHPITGETGAYGPVRPTSKTLDTLTFASLTLPIPAPDDHTSNLGAYAIVAPKEVKFRAYARDQFTGRLIYSNEATLLVELPNYIMGVDSTGVLPIPYGFKIVTDDFNIGSALGESNFITVNPQVSGINQFTMYGDI